MAASPRFEMAHSAVPLSDPSRPIRRSGGPLRGLFDKTPGAAVEAFDNGWDPGADGPAPDVWSPSSSAWVWLLQAQLDPTDLEEVFAKAIATT